ncbi:putative gustatory receptor 59d [Drosophila tropicalis]|uniref:putative gustatory receptor 59d n=1 Tax=Drosophila tropicalis TaxID=46794 RepID=UPI0035ABCE62
MIFSLLPMQYLFGERIRSVLLNPNYLHQYVFLGVGIVRVSGVFITILFRWRERQELVKLVNALYQLYVKRPHVERLYRRGVLNKFLFALLSELLQMFIMLSAVGERLTFGIGLQLYIMSIITAILNVIVTQYYFAMLNIHGHYILLIEELRNILDAVLQLNPHGMGVFITKCCCLADQMDNIAERQSQLQELIKRISKVFGAQYFCINLTYFLTNVATVYFTVMGFRLNRYSPTSNWTVGLFLPCLLFYHLDQYITVLVLLYIEDAHAVVVRLLQSRTSLPLGLDERLELTFESFQLQLVRNPFEINCLGLYTTLLPPKSSPIAMLLKPINEELECLQASAIRARHEQMAMLIVIENRQYKCELDALKKAILNLNNQ